MTSFELVIDEKSLAGSEFMARVANEVRRAAVCEKLSRKLTQQAIADKIGTSRAVINREISGLENLSARRIGELLWALGWEPHFEARKPSALPATNRFDLADSDEMPFKLPPASGESESTITGRIDAGAA